MGTYPPDSDFAITLHFDRQPAQQTSHPGSRTNSYIVKGERVAAADMPDATRGEHWFFIGGVDVVATDGQQPAFGPWSAAALGGDALMLVSAVCVALYYVLSAELTQRYPVITVAAWSSLFGVAVLVPTIPLEVRHMAVAPGWLGIGIVLYLGVLVTVTGIWIWLHTLRLLPARIAAGTQYLQPLIGVGASAWLLGDPIGRSFGIGTVLVLIGIALTTLGRKAGNG